MAKFVVTQTATAEFETVTVRELKMILDQVPEYASVSIKVFAGDQRDRGYTAITFFWRDEPTQ